MKKILLLLITTISIAQSNPKVDFKKLKATITINPELKSVLGDVTFDFKCNKITDTIKIDAVNMEFYEVKINDKIVNYDNTKKQLRLFQGFKKGNNKLTFKYLAYPKQTMYFVGESQNMQIWTQGQGKYTSHWLPSFDDVNEKMIFNLTINHNPKYIVISNGLLKKTEQNNTLKSWQFEMQQPMSSYLVMLAIGEYEVRTDKSKSEISLIQYIEPKDVLKFDSTYKHSKQIFDFLESEIGFKYPWQVYKQVPARDFLYGGMENTTATVFNHDYVVDDIGFNDRSYINVNAHELAHQWFGNLVTAQSGKDQWLQEGFATYYALLAEENIFGEDHFNWKMYEMAERLQKVIKTDTIPILNEKASSLVMYQKGAWALHYLKTKIGKQKFNLAVKNYLKKHQFKNVVTQDFLSEITTVSNFDVKEFKKQWLESSGLPIQDIISILKDNKTLKQYFEIDELSIISFENKEKLFLKFIQSDLYPTIKQEVIYQLKSVSFDKKREIITTAMLTNNLLTRQAIAKTLTDYPDDFKVLYETLLQDKSYLTREIVLNNLWEKYPKEQLKLLEKTKNWVGFNDYNLRILWLTLALKTKDVTPENKTVHYNELLNFASSMHETEVRQNAISNLLELDKNDLNVLPNLVNGLISHKWQMVKFSTEIIRPLIKIKKYRSYFEDLQTKISDKEKINLNKLLTEI